MVPRSLAIIESELKSVQEHVSKALRIKSGSVKDFAHIGEDFLSQNFHPAIVLLTGRMFNIKGRKPASLAAIIQFMYMAAAVHFRIADNDAGHDNANPKDGPQYPVLVGDYLYGCFFTTLCEEEMTEFLEPLAEIICKMNVGGILRTQGFATKDQHSAVIVKEAAVLSGEGCYLTGRLAGASETDLDNIREFGYNIGMGYGYLDRHFPLETAREYFDKGLQVLRDFFPPSEARDALIAFIEAIAKEELKVFPKKYGKRSGNEGNTEGEDKHGIVSENLKKKRRICS